ncbi:uracil-DNA glycosylase [Spongiibacter sp. KMU-158]|uniref:Uracil-DNA glycosylase n=1 Tax=Spongiibacter pelagi TaxID=2760804 RepID=A0A927BZP9_9GAMM|nr:uracil-DNA glycosylase [Spongiibacter pelagi]MBD2858568.1 uracil-DNA glycosylase [Spongiibacter pelagi]
MSRQIQLSASWLNAVGDEFEQPYMQSLKAFLEQRREQGAVIYPRPSHWFAALDAIDFDKVRVVILGQDPYHGPGQAHGLCFSVQPGVAPPPSLLNIFKELQTDIGIPEPHHGYLQHWAEQGVLLLNAVLTVEQGQAGAHQGKGWEQFTDAIVAALNAKREGLVFMLWGSHAQKKGAVIDKQRHLVLRAPHPSPLSAYRGFFGCQHFSQANAYLESQGLPVIDWSLPAE